MSWFFFCFVLWLLTLGSAQTNVVYQPNSVIAAAAGDNVTLRCYRTNKENTDPIIWYKQAAGHESRVMLTVYKLALNPVFEDHFRSPRFTVENVQGHCILNITHVEPSDEATYYCGLKTFQVVFGKGTYLSVKGRNLKLFYDVSNSFNLFPLHTEHLFNPC